MGKIIGAALGIALTGWLLWENSAPEVTEYPVYSERLPEAFEGFRITQISDFHNVVYDPGNQKLLTMVKQTDPDILVFTGDIIDSRRLHPEVAVSFVREASRTAPCYFVPGNHESRLSQLPELLEQLRQAGMTVLRNEAVTLQRGEQEILLLGADDPAFHPDYKDGQLDPEWMEIVSEWAEKDRTYTILLSHRPEWFSLYRDSRMDLVFSGHVHGGQFRIPFVGGVYGPNQGFFPEYDAGVFGDQGCTMVVSRGVGPSIIPLRINNRPEIVVAELHKQGE